jgi:hypothetical protein
MCQAYIMGSWKRQLSPIDLFGLSLNFLSGQWQQENASYQQMAGKNAYQ